MSGKQYLKNQLPVILINLLGMLVLALFLIASDNPIQTVLFIFAVWSIVLVLSLLAFYFSRKKYLNKLLNMTEQLEERYLLPEIMQVPERADEQVFYQIMKMAEKSMLERIGEVQRERREYKEYIEQWIHEVKTPITAMKLLCENNRSPFSREVLAELENINQYTEQALYYARSEHAEKDYSVREVNLCDVVHSAIADNKYLDCQHFFRQIFLGYFSDIVQAFDTLRKNVCGDDYTSLHNPIVLSSVLPAYGMFHSIQILFL